MFNNVRIFIAAYVRQLMKKFNLEKALAGEQVVNGKGELVTNIAYFPNANNEKLAGVLKGQISTWFECGNYLNPIREVAVDESLFMADSLIKNYKWVNIYKPEGTQIISTGRVFDTKEKAIEQAMNGCIATVKIEVPE